MKIVEAIIDFILGMIKRAFTLVTVGIILLFTAWVFAVLLPEDVMNAVAIFQSIAGS